MSDETPRAALIRDLVEHIGRHGDTRLHEVMRRHEWKGVPAFFECVKLAKLDLANRGHGEAPKQSSLSPAQTIDPKPLPRAQIDRVIALYADAAALRNYALNDDGAIRDPAAFVEGVNARFGAISDAFAIAKSYWEVVDGHDFTRRFIDYLLEYGDVHLCSCVLYRCMELVKQPQPNQSSQN